MTLQLIDRQKEFQTYASALRRDVDEGLDRLLPRPPSCPAVVADAMRYAVGTRGKRFRPILTLASADAVVNVRSGATAAERAEARRLALPAACAIEFVHAQSLVHDDLPSMDNDTMRRGQPTLHVCVGEALAILAGDGLLAEAFLLLAREARASEPTAVSPELALRTLRVIEVLGQAVGPAGMVGGQAIDIGATGPHAHRISNLATLQDMHGRKTGGLIRAAAVAGAIMAGGSREQVLALGEFASEVGLAFQIVDDILDVEGVPAAVGKTPGKDAAAGKPTYPSFVGLERARAMAADAVARGEAALTRAGLVDHHLLPLAQWVLTRRC